MVSRYSYEELRAKATAPGASQSDVDALGQWFEAYGSRYWMGDRYDADGLYLYPLYKQIGEDQHDIIGYTFDQTESLESLEPNN